MALRPPTASNAGQSFRPLVGQQYEVGAKFQTIGTTIAYFDITKASEFMDFATNTFVQAGQQRNRGIEVTEERDETPCT